MLNKSSTSWGQSLLEVIVVVAVTVIVVGALVFSTITGLRNAAFAKNQSQATKLAQEGLEKIRSLRDRDEQDKVYYDDTKQQADQFSDLWNIRLSCQSNNCYFILVGDILRNVNSFSNVEHVEKGLGRRIEIEDIADGSKEKKITAIVSWTDFSGSHQSSLTTILRKI